MPNQWFRLYSEFADDPKVQMMPEAMQRRLIMLFCERCKCETLHETQRAFHWRVTPEELAKTKALFLENDFIDEDWNLTNWDKRQFLSDSSTDRVRRYRQALKQDETLQKRSTSVTVTAPDTEQIQKQNRTEKNFSTQLPPAVIRLPATGGKEYAVTQDQVIRWKELYPAVDVMQDLRAMVGWLEADPKRKKTTSGMNRFINNWLAKSQNSGHRNGGNSNGFITRSDQNQLALNQALAEIERDYGSAE